MTSIRKSTLIISLIFTILVNTFAPPSVQAQNPLTAAAIIAAAEQLQNSLNNLPANLGANASGVITGASTQLGVATQELRRLVGDQLTIPITSLGYDAQNAARRLSNATEQLEQTIQQQRTCAVQDLNIFLASLKTITDQLKTGIFFVKTGAPYLNFYEFYGHSKLVVPLHGGRVAVSGFSLWVDQTLPPIIEIVDETKKVIARPAAERGTDNNQVTFSINEALVKSHVGECLAFHIQPRRKEGLVFKKIVTYDLNLPFCIPASEYVAYSIVGTVYSKCSRQVPKSWSEEHPYLENEDCDNNRPIGSTTKIINTDPNCHITAAPGSPTGNIWNVLRADFGFTDTSITWSGELDKASCARIGFIKKRTHTSTWDYIIRPVGYCTIMDSFNPSSVSSVISMSGPETQLVVEIPKNCDFPTSDYEFKVLQTIPGSQPVEIYNSSRITCNEKGGCIAPIGRVNNLSINGTYTPGIAANLAQISVKLKSLSCGY